MSAETHQVTLENQAREVRSGLVRNLRIVSLATLLSRFLGLARDIAMATVFGAGTTLDVFIVAFRLPNLSRQLFGEGALTTAFLPLYLRERHERGDLSARATMTAVAVVLAAFLSCIVLCCEAAIAWSLFTLTLTDSTRLLLQLLAILLPYMVFICTAALLSAALHALKIFLWPALVPVVLNLIWLSGVITTLCLTPDEHARIRIVASFITLAGVCQFLLPLYVLQRLGLSLTSRWRSGLPRVKEVITTMIPVVIGLTVMQINVVLDSMMAWGLSSPDTGGPAPLELWGLPALLPSGTATALYFGQRMYQFPLGVFGIALGTVLFPLLTQHAQAGNLPELRRDLTKGIRLTIAIALPASAGLFVLASPLTNLLFRHGKFTAEDSALTATMIATYGCGVAAYIGLTVLNRAFYATGDRITPMRFGVLALLLNIVINCALIVPLQGIGLALGSVLSALVQLLCTSWRLHRQMGPLDWNAVWHTLWRSCLSTGVLLLVCVVILKIMPPAEGLRINAMLLFVPFLLGTLSYFLTARLVGMTELDEILRRDPK